MNAFSFESMEEAFYRRMIPPITFTAQGRNDVSAGEVLMIGRSSVLNPSIRMVQPSCGTLLFQSHRQRVRRNLRVERVARGPANNLPRVSVEHRGKVEPALSGRNIRTIGEPDPVGCLRCKVAGKQVGSKRIDMSTGRVSSTSWQCS